MNDYLKRNPQTASAAAGDLPLVANTEPNFIVPDVKSTSYLVSAEKTLPPPEKRKFAVPKFNIATQERRASAFKPREAESGKQVDGGSVSFSHKLDFPYFNQNQASTS